MNHIQVLSSVHTLIGNLIIIHGALKCKLNENGYQQTNITKNPTFANVVQYIQLN